MEKRGERLTSLKAIPLFQPRYVPVVRIINPFVANTDVLLYLKSRVEDVKGGTWMVDEGGFWTLKWHFAAKLREDLRAPGGVVHLPGTFYIRPDRGTISYPGPACKGEVCRFCHSAEHSSDQCSAPKRCKLCGDEGHLYRDCPSNSWSDVVSGAAGSQEKQAGDSEDGGGQQA